MPSKVFKSVAEYEAHLRGEKLVKAPSGDPLERFYSEYGWWFTGEIQIFENGKALPTLIKIADAVETRQKSREGWRPVQDPEVPDLVIDLLRKYHGEEGLPEALAAQLAPRLPRKVAVSKKDRE